MVRKSELPTVDSKKELKRDKGGSYTMTVPMVFLKATTTKAENGEKIIPVDEIYAPPIFAVKVRNADKLDYSNKFEEDAEYEVKFSFEDPKSVLKNELKSPFIAGKKKVIITCDSRIALRRAEEVIDRYREVEITGQRKKLVECMDIDSKNKKIEFRPKIPDIAFEEAVRGIQKHLRNMADLLVGYFGEKEMRSLRNSQESCREHLNQADEPIDILWMCLTAAEKRALNQQFYLFMDMEKRLQDEEITFPGDDVIIQLVVADKLERIGDKLEKIGLFLDEIIKSKIEVNRLAPLLKDAADFIENNLHKFIDLTCDFVLDEPEEWKWRSQYEKINEVVGSLSDKQFSEHFKEEDLELVSEKYSVMVRILEEIVRDAVAIFRWKVSV